MRPSILSFAAGEMTGPLRSKQEPYQFSIKTGRWSANISVEYSQVCLLGKTVAHLQRLGLFDDVSYPFFGVSYSDQDAECHTSLTGSTESSACDSVECRLLAGIWHEDGVVLGSQIGLAGEVNTKSDMMYSRENTRF